ncbi:MAG: TlyA family RNA methyltransferase [Chthoniobacterales bacterium]|jgi:23S rRNA (cytidine1920-2'-O)/16S rRNA (cytidine1409-2'-O)-methyltransferase|nr:TlyA family RNA methyltransferase [Chthoniobacterales bacterium]
MAKRARLDTILVQQGLFGSREQAQRAVMAGLVKLGDRVLNKSSILVEHGARLSVAAPPKFVGRGGLKLDGALDHFGIKPAGMIALDIGASTGGFTDCLLQRGVAKVYAIDVGHGQIAWKIRNDPRVVVHENLNARYLGSADVTEPIDLCVIDVSFISLTLILPRAFDLITPTGVTLALIKPQFELQPQDVGRGGIVADPTLHEKAQRKVQDFLLAAGHVVIGTVASRITGTDGNQEFFVCTRKQLA